MSESKRTSVVLEDTNSLLTTILNDERYYKPVWSLCSPTHDPGEVVFIMTLVIMVEGARVVLPDSVLKEVESYNSKIRDTLLKPSDIFFSEAKRDTSSQNPETLFPSEEFITKCVKLKSCLNELWALLAKEVIETALRGHFPHIGGMIE